MKSTLFTIVFTYLNKIVKNNKKKRIRIAGIFCFLLYILLLVYLLFFAEWYGREPSKTRNYQYNLVLFQEIRRYWNYRTQLGFQAVFLNLFGNILGFIPFGFLLPALSTRLRNPWTVIFMGFSFRFKKKPIILLLLLVNYVNVHRYLLNNVWYFWYFKK